MTSFLWNSVRELTCKYFKKVSYKINVQLYFLPKLCRKPKNITLNEMVEDDKKVVKGAVKQRQKLIGVAVIPSDILQTNQKGLVENYLLNWIMVVLKTLIWKYFYFVVLFSSLISLDSFYPEYCWYNFIYSDVFW